MMYVDLDATFFYLPIIYCIHVLFTYILYFLGLGGQKKNLMVTISCGQCHSFNHIQKKLN